MEPSYVTGFVESAGSFTFSRQGGVLVLVFAVRRPPADRALLESLRDFFGAGAIYQTAGSLHYRVTRIDELPTIVDHFEKHPLLGAKRAAYGLWREMVGLKSGRFRRPPREELEALAARLRAAR